MNAASLSATGPSLRDVARYWESARIYYNAVLMLVVAAWVGLTWPHFQAAMTWESLGKCLVLAAAANALYCGAYAADILLQLLADRKILRRGRRAVWLLGTVFAILLANYWIADEIYSYV